MKQKLRLRDNYGPKRTQPKQGIRILNIQAVRNILTRCIAYMLWIGTYKKVHYWYFTRTLPVLKERLAFIRTFFSLCSAVMRAVCVLDVCRIREILAYRMHTAHIRHGGWCNKGRRKAEEKAENVKESCVCTHAKAPARYGLGLALGLAVLLLLGTTELGIAQESFSVHGKVISAASGTAIEGATVTNKRTRIHVVTDEIGDYRIPARPDDILIYSFVGYMTTEEEIAGRQQITVALDSADNMLDEVEVVSTGYQTIPKERATGSFVFVDSELLNRAVSTDIISRLKGVVPSLLFDERAGGEPKLSIRGRSTIFANADPLIVVDNFPYEGDIRNINPNDVESVSILRDAAAASIWGVRAGNGVIVITTKKGKAGQPLQVSFNGNVTVGEKPDLYYLPRISSADQVDVEEFLYQQGYYRSNLNNTTTYPVVPPAVEILADTMLSELEQRSRLDDLKRQDIRKDIDRYFYRTSINQQYALNLRGGGQFHCYFFSAGHDNVRNSVVGDHYQRVNLNAQNTFTLFPKLEMGMGLHFSQSSRQSDNLLASLAATYPYERLADENGNPLPITQGLRMAFVETAENSGRLNWNYIPLEEGAHRDNSTGLNHYRANARMRYELPVGLAIEGYYQYENQRMMDEQLYGQGSYHVRNWVNRFASLHNGGMEYNLPLGAILHRMGRNLETHNARGLLTYQRTAGAGEWNLLAGYEVREAKTKGFGSSYFGYNPVNGTTTSVNLDSSYVQYPSGRQRISSLSNQGISGYLERFRSMFFNGSYRYLGRYVLSASARIDQTNLFGVKANQRTVPLWSAGAKWDINREAFYGIDWLPVLTLRSSYGFNGNFDGTAQAYVTATYGVNQYRLREARLGSLPNPQLSGERTAVLNIGVDFGLRNGVLTGRVDHYRRWGRNLIATRPIDPTTGRNTFRGNVAHMDGLGWDVELSSRNLKGRVGWSTSFLFSYSRDKVIKLFETGASYFNDASLLGRAYAAAEGKPLFGVYSYRWAGLDPETGDPLGYLNGEVSNDYLAIQGSIQSADDLVYHGTYVPIISGGLRNEISYGNVSLSFNITYKLDYFFRRASIASAGMLGAGAVKFPDYARRWQQPGDELYTHVPSFVYPVSTARVNFYQNSAVLIEKGDHIRLQDVRLSYTYRRLQGFVYANNLGIIWRANKHGIDPDFNSNDAATTGSIVSAVIPPPKTIAIGIQITF